MTQAFICAAIAIGEISAAPIGYAGLFWPNMPFLPEYYSTYRPKDPLKAGCFGPTNAGFGFFHIRCFLKLCLKNWGFQAIMFCDR
jgi:hypothetical protein